MGRWGDGEMREILIKALLNNGMILRVRWNGHLAWKRCRGATRGEFNSPTENAPLRSWGFPP
ncbi:hypothetical protein [Moorena producens]|uniref:hypothetical protein n=1 Tax=Moorena producens TaxID=1155739 RepID=UPI003C72E722